MNNYNDYEDTHMKLFISYKRDTGIDIAARIRDYLVNNGHDVFFDIEDMHLGRFENQIEQFISECDSFILILTKGALESEWVQKEIRLELKKKKPNIIPIFKDDFKMDKSLPKDIQSVMEYHGIKYDPILFSQVMEKLSELLIKDTPITPLNEVYEKISTILSNMMIEVTNINIVMMSKNITLIIAAFNKMAEVGKEIKEYQEYLKDKNPELSKMLASVRESWNDSQDKYEELIKEAAKNPDSEKIKTLSQEYGQLYSYFVSNLATTLGKVQMLTYIKK